MQSNRSSDSTPILGLNYYHPYELESAITLLHPLGLEEICKIRNILSQHHEQRIATVFDQLTLRAHLHRLSSASDPTYYRSSTLYPQPNPLSPAEPRTAHASTTDPIFWKFIPPKKKLIACPNIDCDKHFVTTRNFILHIKKHIASVRHQTHKYECKHVAGTKCFNITLTEEDWDSHHRAGHPDCTDDSVNCRSRKELPDQNVFACGLCPRIPFPSLDEWATHHANHFLELGHTKTNLNISHVIQNLLDQPKTMNYWHEQRRLFFGEDWNATCTWNWDNAQVKLLALVLGAGCPNDMSLEDDQNARSLVDHAIYLCEFLNTPAGDFEGLL